MDINKLTAAKIKELRTELGYTSEYLAIQLGIAKSSYSQLENRNVEITLRKINQIADIFNVPIIALIPGVKSQTIQIINGADSSIKGTQINNSVSPEFLEIVKSAIVELQKINKSYN